MNNRLLYTPKEKRQFGDPKKSRKLWIIGGVGVVIFLIAGAVLMVRTESFRVSTISVMGIDSLHEDDVRRSLRASMAGSYFGVVPYAFLLATPTGMLADKLKHDFPLIAEVNIAKEFPRTLSVTVKERTLFGIMCNDKVDEAVALQEGKQTQCVYVDSTGFAYQQAPQTNGLLITKISTDMPDITVGTQVIDKGMMQRIVDVSRKIPSVIGTPIVGYEFLSAIAHEVRVMTRRGFSLMIERDNNLDNTIYVLKTVLEKEIGSKRDMLDYIDLRFGNKVFYKLK